MGLATGLMGKIKVPLWITGTLARIRTVSAIRLPIDDDEFFQYFSRFGAEKWPSNRKFHG